MPPLHAPLEAAFLCPTNILRPSKPPYLNRNVFNVMAYKSLDLPENCPFQVFLCFTEKTEEF